MKTFDLESRVFTYSGNHYECHEDEEYTLTFVPAGKKREKRAYMRISASGRYIVVNSGITAISPTKERMYYRCKGPSGIEFNFGGTYANFRDLYGIGKEDVKQSSRQRIPLANGWQFWRLGYVT